MCIRDREYSFQLSNIKFCASISLLKEFFLATLNSSCKDFNSLSISSTDSIAHIPNEIVNIMRKGNEKLAKEPLLLVWKFHRERLFSILLICNIDNTPSMTVAINERDYNRIAVIEGTTFESRSVYSGKKIQSILGFSYRTWGSAKLALIIFPWYKRLFNSILTTWILYRKKF